MSTSKADIAKNHQILKALVKQPGNNHCADCKTATHPRWASWNLGIFICIRCSGIHRSMGTHISRVKSVDLDSWTNEQTESMLKWGNSKANTFWEAQLPGEPGQYAPDDSKIENFIKTKYDLKKWAASKTVPNPSSLSVKASQPQVSQQQPQTQPHQNRTPQAQQVNKENRKLNNTALLDLEFGSPVASSTNSLPSQSKSNAHTAHHHQIQQHAQRQPQAPQQNNSRPDLKKSILSLYSTPHVSNSTPNFPIRTNTPSSLQQQQQPYINSNSTHGSLSGLNFNTGSSNSSVSTPNQWSNSPSPQNQWNNTAQQQQQQQRSFGTGNAALDDDLFKNHWN